MKILGLDNLTVDQLNTVKKLALKKIEYHQETILFLKEIGSSKDFMAQHENKIERLRALEQAANNLIIEKAKI